MFSAIYAALLFACSAYALLHGGKPERIGAAILGVGSIATFLVVSAPAARFGSVELGILFVDVAALAGFLALALRAERLWPLWLTALHAIGTAAHVVKLVAPDVIPWAYAFALAFWSYPMLLLLVLGTWQHRKRLARHGADKSWSTFSSRSAPARRAGPGA
ncbi:MAG TPA: hypothetical protein VEZ70_04660 [Allosphingosinicella sp.]|nr:hypothetical protein [Allosphingosinicella sp.]